MDIKILETTSKIRVLVLSDSHVGSLTGILHLTAKDTMGNPVKSFIGNNIYRKLMKELSKVGKVDVLIILGDGPEGIASNIMGYKVQTTNTNLTVQWTTEIVSDIIQRTKPDYIYYVNGTPTHVGQLSLDEQVFQQIKLKFPNLKGYFDDAIELKIGELWYHLAHFYPESINPFTGTKNLLQQIFEDAGIQRTRIYDVVLRGHTHRYNWNNYRGRIIIATCPCLQAITSYWKRKGKIGRPDIGYLLIEQEDRKVIPKQNLF